MKRSYRIVTHKNSRGLADYLARNGQFLLPMVELIESSRMAIEELIDILGRAGLPVPCPADRHRGRAGAVEHSAGRVGRREGNVVRARPHCVPSTSLQEPKKDIPQNQ